MLVCVPIVVACRCPVCVQWYSREPLSVYIQQHTRSCSTHQMHGQIGCDSRQLACNAVLAAVARAAPRAPPPPAPRAAASPSSVSPRRARPPELSMAQEVAEALGLSVAADPRAQFEGLGPRGMVLTIPRGALRDVAHAARA